jgi:hypothetical protein
MMLGKIVYTWLQYAMQRANSLYTYL